ncbi:MAG: AAA family ATPase [Rhodothermaceae bacterium]|nr:AAA family ATPase [Rhodothermaceae bacterium]MYG69881.1 AAA family ATPase [Rhodothermaceae bacterium]
MKLREVTIHNIRSVAHATFELSDYSILVGENNAGKTNIFTALRLFYENGVKYRKDDDYPKFAPPSGESWIELSFETTDDEQRSLKAEYRSRNRILRTRRYFQAEDRNLVKANQSNIYAYESGELSKNLFYGAKNVSQAKLGNVIYIPATGKTSETLKLSGSSPFRDILNLIMKRAVLESPTFKDLSDAFNSFNSDFRQESSDEGFSVESFVREINSEIGGWDVHFDVSVNTIKPEEIVKTLLSYHIEDIHLGGERIDIASFGQGFQRHLIFTLIKLSAKYGATSTTKKKDFDPDFNLLLFEEPEAFLHPSQQEVLCLSLRTLSNRKSEQVLVSSHSPHFVSKQISYLTGIIRLSRDQQGMTKTFQINKHDLSQILDGNVGLYQKFCDCLESEKISEEIKKEIRSRHLGEADPDLGRKLEEEAIRYFLWFDSERSSMFFAKKVIICEGATEKIFIDYLFDECWQEFRERHIYLLNAQGKFNIHRYMALLAALGIEHSVLFDSDRNLGIHEIVNSFLEIQKNDFTGTVHWFDKDFEDFLGIEKLPGQSYKNPLNVMMKYHKDEIISEKLDELRDLLEKM